MYAYVFEENDWKLSSYLKKNPQAFFTHNLQKIVKQQDKSVIKSHRRTRFKLVFYPNLFKLTKKLSRLARNHPPLKTVSGFKCF